MLVLSRKAGESISIDHEIKVTVLSVRGSRVRIGLEAPDDVDIVRSELVEWTPEESKPSKSESWSEAEPRPCGELTFSI